MVSPIKLAPWSREVKRDGSVPEEEQPDSLGTGAWGGAGNLLAEIDAARRHDGLGDRDGFRVIAPA